MRLFKEQTENAAVTKFKLQGFPEEPTLKTVLEQVFAGQAVLPREFEIYNMFGELIFSGSVDERGKLVTLQTKDRRETAMGYKKETA